MFVTVLGIVTDLIISHILNAPSSIKVVPLNMVIELREPHPSNASPGIQFRLPGIVIERSPWP